jgi:hypothetical protein
METSPITPDKCIKLYNTVFGNGNPGLVQRTEKLEVVLIGDSKTDGALTLLRQIDERTRATEEYRIAKEEEARQKPVRRRDTLKDWLGMLNLLFLMAKKTLFRPAHRLALWALQALPPERIYTLMSSRG